MPYVNKISLREEIDRIKESFQQLSSDGKITSEVLVLFNAMILLLDVIAAAFLEKTTKKTSKNSSKPPSQTEKDDSCVTDHGANSKGKGENGDSFPNSRTVEKASVARVNSCDTCGENLEAIGSEPYERRTKIDIVFEKVVHHVDREVKTCPECEEVTKGQFPEDMPGPLQYGSGIKAYVLDLVIAQMISLSRARKAIKTLIGIAISEATILKYVAQLNLILERWESEQLQQILDRPSIHVDETSMRVDKKNFWIHAYSSGDITLKLLHQKRGKEAIEDIGIIPKYGGVIVHDCWASYFSYDHCGHGLCGSHLLRELTFIIDSNGYAWATNMKALLKETCKEVSKRKHKKLTKKEYSALQKRYRNIVTRGGKELPPIARTAEGKRGRIAKSDAHNLWERFKDHEEAVLLFAKDSNVSFTNNRAERDLRMGKVKQKVSGCFRSGKYAQAYCRISSYLQTMANKGYNPLVAIQMALSGQIYARTGE